MKKHSLFVILLSLILAVSSQKYEHVLLDGGISREAKMDI
jgi:hypothetical protein